MPYHKPPGYIDRVSQYLDKRPELIKLARTAKQQGKNPYNELEEVKNMIQKLIINLEYQIRIIETVQEYDLKEEGLLEVSSDYE